MLSYRQQLQDDCTIVLDRIFHGQSLIFFGEDGNGLYGKSTFPLTCRIRCINVEVISYSDDLSEVEALLRIFLDGYDSDVTGHAISDANLRINLNQLLALQMCRPDTLRWASVDVQGKDFITLEIDVQRLLWG